MPFITIRGIVGGARHAYVWSGDRRRVGEAAEKGKPDNGLSAISEVLEFYFLDRRHFDIFRNMFLRIVRYYLQHW
jgi:hypothetical protein